jgi:hypothetical protein
MNVSFFRDVAERAGRTFIQAYLAVWIANGASFDGLTDMGNAEAGAVAVALSIAMAVGLKNAGPHKDSASIQ